MQKLITISIDTNQITKSTEGPFTINEVESLNEWLALGWEVEDWDFLKEVAVAGEVTLLVILNDNALYENDDDFYPDEDEEDEE
ncbi:hypothetical protein BH11BAC3_BH11BAC3_45050 [soil metagenome]